MSLLLYYSSPIIETVAAIPLSYVIEDIVEQRLSGEHEALNYDKCIAMYKSEQRIPIIIKIDIENFECRTFVGSPGIFSDPRVFIPFIVMEWSYRKALPPAEVSIYTVYL